MQAGAIDYLQKPFVNEAVVEKLARLEEVSRSEHTVRNATAPPEEPGPANEEAPPRRRRVEGPARGVCQRI